MLTQDSESNPDGSPIGGGSQSPTKYEVKPRLSSPLKHVGSLEIKKGVLFLKTVDDPPVLAWAFPLSRVDYFRELTHDVQPTTRAGPNCRVRVGITTRERGLRTTLQGARARQPSGPPRRQVAALPRVEIRVAGELPTIEETLPQVADGRSTLPFVLAR